MATPSNIGVSPGYCIVEENTSTGITPQSGANIGTVVVAEPTGLAGVGQQVLFSNSEAYVIKQGGNSYTVIPVKNILVTHIPPVVS